MSEAEPGQPWAEQAPLTRRGAGAAGRSRGWPRSLVVALVFAGVGLVAGGAFFVPQWVGRVSRGAAIQRVARTLPAELAGARREGLPLTPSDLRRLRPPVPPAQNAAEIYRKTQTFFERTPKAARDADSNVLAVLLKTRTAVDRNRAREVLARSARLLRLAEQAAARPHCDFNRPWEQGPDVTFPEYAPARHLCRLLAARAVLETESGRPEAALRDIAAGARVGRHMGEDLTLIGLLVQIACQVYMDRAFQAVLSRYGDRPDVLRLAGETQHTFGPPINLRASLGYEVVMGRVQMDRVRREPQTLGGLNDHMNDPDQANQEIPINLGDASPQTRKAFTDAWEARLIAFWRQAFRILDADRSDPHAAAPGALRTLARQEEARWNHGNDLTYFMNVILVPDLDKAAEKAAQHEAERRLRAAALALLAHKQRTGRFPAALADLSAPPLPAAADPFTRGGEPLHYRRTARGFVLYSVGQNLRDDGGDGERKKKGASPPDLVFAYP